MLPEYIQRTDSFSGEYWIDSTQFLKVTWGPGIGWYLLIILAIILCVQQYFLFKNSKQDSETTKEPVAEV